MRLLLARELNQTRARDDALRDLKYLGQRFLVAGLPDDQSKGCLRSVMGREVMEPAEYYGLMIEPLVLAYEQTGDPEWLAQVGLDGPARPFSA